ncbi:MAG: DNA repair protein RecN [Syntrophobacteraceae bacterium]
MLRELIVNNFAIIQNLEAPFHEGLNIISGETGAGKSIIVGAVNLILGSRASQEMIRTGAKEATVECVFSPETPEAMRERLSALDLEAADEIIIRRAINRSGRNRIFINEQTATLQQLQQLAKSLISVSGQHEHQLLLDPAIHLDLLDAFGELEPRRNEVYQLYTQWSGVREELRKLRRMRQEREAQYEWMRFQYNEMESAKIQPDEDLALEQERNVLRHAATLVEAAERAYGALYAERGAIIGKLSEVEKDLLTLERIDPTQDGLRDHVEQSVIHLEELAHSLQQYAHSISSDPQRLAAVEERLAQLQRLGKKYGNGEGVAGILKRFEELRQALGDGDDPTAVEEKLEKDQERFRGLYLDTASELSRRRREAALRLDAEVEATLAALDMPHARFGVSFGNGNDDAAMAEAPFTPAGIDRVEFLLSANPGEELKPLVRIASGGELSRILLALKSLLSLKGEAETLIFDEVDTGIGGRTAELVGLQLKKLAGKNQVICITHLPQIACYGEHHFKVSKQTTGKETVTSLRPLTSKERIEELARMLGGVSISEKTRAHAREFLERAQEEFSKRTGH